MTKVVLIYWSLELNPWCDTRNTGFFSEEIKNTTALNILFPISFIFESARRLAHEISRKKNGLSLLLLKIYQFTPVGQFFLLVLWTGTGFILLCDVALKPGQRGSFWLPRALTSGVKFSPSFQFPTAFPCFWVLVPQGESRLHLKKGCCSIFYWCWLGAVGLLCPCTNTKCCKLYWIPFTSCCTSPKYFRPYISNICGSKCISDWFDFTNNFFLTSGLESQI